MKRLIINADDFGLAPGVNRAIVELQQAGALSSTTLMATAPYFSPAVYLAFAQPRWPSAAMWCWWTARPACTLAKCLPCSTRASGSSLPATVGSFFADLLRGRIREQEIEAEAIAQIRRIQSSGLTVSHIDSHKHLHASSPGAGSPASRGAPLRGLLRSQSVRAVVEPARHAGLPAPGGERKCMPCAPSGRAFSRLIMAQHGMTTADGSIGLLATGILDDPVLRSLLQAMPSGTWELVCHPGYNDRALDQARTRLRASRETERGALLEVIPEALRNDSGLALIDFHQLARHKDGQFVCRA